ncbi:histone-lysine N-methyltransferase NSD2 [Trichonephila clavata]|uniref:Histone-lysine N-methyltransferase NSD2 n=1 Tax=Trichonephila clavata TaxID=2740835 RepID=A0A8X6LW42_TRICU|nr:histone-lysine N-methyltransferase NSD2 [Trichonephila clavata]
MSLTTGKRKRVDDLEKDDLESETKCLKSDETGNQSGEAEITESEENSNSSLHSDSKSLGYVSDNTSSETRHECFLCKSEDSVLIKCPLESCDKYYHSKCSKKLPTSKTVCPLHVCLSCYLITPKNSHFSKGNMYKCSQCPTAFHTKEECIIPGAVISSSSDMLCPNHFSPEKERGYSAVMNLCFCVQCGCNEDLIYCSSCPFAIHKKCSRTENFNNDIFTCDRCRLRKSVYFNDIVWAKVYNFRWWPAKVLNPKNVPANVRKMQHFDGEFLVQFFETCEYYWTQKGRVHPFIFKQVGLEDKNLEHNFKKTFSDCVFDKAVQLACKALSDKKFTETADTGNPKKPPPYRHIKSNRPIGDVQIYTSHDSSDHNPCGCKATDTNPCGYDSLCLNRSMCTECDTGVCEAGDLCENQKFQRLQYASVKPFWTSTKAWGLQCLEDIKKGHFVIEYCGDLIDEEECERRIKQMQETGDTNFYFCTLDSNRIIDAGPKGNFSRFMNHSCDPNCETQKWMVNGDARVGIFAKKDIPAGSELTFDYQMDFSHYEKLKCNCGSKRCSGLIGKKPQNASLISDESPMLEPKNSKNSKKEKTSKKVNGVSEKNASKVNGLKKEVNIKKQCNSKKESGIKKQNGLKKDKLLCFKCKTGGRLLHCTLEECGKSFHTRCLKPGMEDTQTDDWECPCHFCQKCRMLSSYQCFLCPNSYCFKHVVNIPKSGKFFCPKHSE